MSSNIFLIIAVVTTGIFVIQFILSIFFGDIDGLFILMRVLCQSPLQSLE